MAVTRRVGDRMWFPSDGDLTVVRTLGDVESILVSARWLRHTPQTTLEIDSVPAQEAARIQTRINLRAAECGCNAGSVTAAVALVAFLSYLALSQGSPFHWGLQHVLVGTGIVIASALMGKAFGIVRARLRLVDELKRLRDRLLLANRPAAEG